MTLPSTTVEAAFSLELMRTPTGGAAHDLDVLRLLGRNLLRPILFTARAMSTPAAFEFCIQLVNVP